MNSRPQIGLGVFVRQGQKILLGRRLSTHGHETWGLPGGHLEFGESFEACAIRETYEETGLKISEVKFFAVTNDIFPQSNKHYVTIFMISDTFAGTPLVCEPDKCAEWQWFDVPNMPEKLFLPLQNLIDNQPALFYHHGLTAKATQDRSQHDTHA